MSWERDVSTRQRLKLALGQMLVEGGKLRENLSRAAEMVSRAASQDCRVVVLPECLDLGWAHPSASQLAAEIPGPTSDALCHLAAATGLYIVAGLTERAGQRTYNAAVLIGPDGRLLAKHRKINLLDIEQPEYAIGDRLQVSETEWGGFGIDICADNFPDSLALGHALARMGAQIILSPCAWAVPADHDPPQNPYGALWEDAYGTLAKLYQMPVVGVSSVGWLSGGAWAGRKCIGCSLAVGGEGNILAKGEYGVDAEQLITVEIELSPRTAKGTDIALMLRRQGYAGPL